MEAILQVRVFRTFNSGEAIVMGASPFHVSSSRRRRNPKVSALRSTLSSGDEALQLFLEERQINGDFVSRAYDILWRRDDLKILDTEATIQGESSRQLEEVTEADIDGGFLKLTKTKEWVLGDETAPINRKAVLKKLQDDRERMKRLNLLKYDAIKQEMMMLTAGIGTLCSGYCLVTLSVQAAISYATGVVFSCLYLQLLCLYVDNLSREAVPQIFKQKKVKKIGIRSEDLQNVLERTLNGSAIALSSPRLMMPVVIYGFWGLSSHFPNDLFNFQLVPAMVGLFAYKAAALVQVYRDNEDLQLIFPDSED